MAIGSAVAAESSFIDFIRGSSCGLTPDGVISRQLLNSAVILPVIIKNPVYAAVDPACEKSDITTITVRDLKTTSYFDVSDEDIRQDSESLRDASEIVNMLAMKNLTSQAWMKTFEAAAVWPTLWETAYYTQARDQRSHRLTTLYANSREDAEELCRLRGLHEKVLHQVNTSRDYIPVLTSCYIRARRWAQAAHACTWLCMIAVAAKVVDALDVLGDDGILHEVMHMAETESRGNRVRPDHIEHLTKRVIETERLTPGMWPLFSNPYDQKVVDKERLAFFNGMTEYEAERTYLA